MLPMTSPSRFAAKNAAVFSSNVCWVAAPDRHRGESCVPAGEAFGTTTSLRSFGFPPSITDAL